MTRSRVCFGVGGRTVRVVLVMLTVGLLAGCVEVFQYVSRTEDGKTHTTVAVRIQKAIFEVAAGLSGEGPPDYEQEFGFTEDNIPAEYPEWLDFTFNVIDTDLEYGFEFSVSVDSDRVHDQDELLFLPRTENQATVIPFDGFDSEDADDDFAMAFFASSKYRLILSKKHTPEVSAAWFESAGNQAPVALHEYDDIYYIEFPMLYLFASGADARLYLTH